MGQSKFPGKPSKLATKKRVSVVNNSLKGLHVDNVSKNDGKYLPKYSASDQYDGCNESTSTATTTTTSATGEANKAHDGDLQVRDVM